MEPCILLLLFIIHKYLCAMRVSRKKIAGNIKSRRRDKVREHSIRRTDDLSRRILVVLSPDP